MGDIIVPMSAMSNPSMVSDSQSIRKVKLLVLKCRISGRTYKVLIDSGATHSFVSKAVVSELDLPVRASSLTARLADNRRIVLEELSRPLTLQFDNFTVTESFYVMDNLSYDFLLGKA